jgi:hypothetical protein
MPKRYRISGERFDPTKHIDRRRGQAGPINVKRGVATFHRIDGKEHNDTRLDSRSARLFAYLRKRYF